ncbi:MarR family winged helix-turn-helix transcriptional regulator [Nocardioides litoris]|uniref:MarR family winged helix-turn-helix transcriptional regulator n=1 Tax=Nocardioides litoris TaxID=1926648 RepID=UPI0011233DB9|nr:MarR family winged helix-turn-helix transcriptional regulator [Nocardioides litoris]
MPSDPPRLDPVQLGAYFALMDVAGMLRHRVEQQLKEEGDLSYVQFQLLARLALDSTDGSARMTDLADGVVYSRSGLTYQVGLLEKAGLVTRAASQEDERVVVVTVTEEGRSRVRTVLPGHVDVVRDQLVAALPGAGIGQLADLLAPVRDHMRAAPPRSAATRRGR